MRDAKFGTYCHWGVYTVPAYGNEQYFHYLHQNDSSDNFLMGTHRQHVARFGPLEKFGYHGKGASFRLKSVLPSKLIGNVKKATLLSVKRNYECTALQANDGLYITIPNNARMPSDAAGVIKIDIE